MFVLRLFDNHTQADANSILSVATSTDGVFEVPDMEYPTYVYFVSPDVGFGIMSAGTIPFVEPKKSGQPDQLAQNSNTSAIARGVQPAPLSVIGSYGGLVCTYSERHDNTEIYELDGKLPRNAKLAKYVSFDFRLCSCAGISKPA